MTALDQLQAEYADARRYEQRAEHFLLEANKRTAEAAAAVAAYIADREVAAYLAEKRADDHLADAADHADDMRALRGEL